MIFCFSSTGNSLWVANRMARSLGDRVTLIAEAIDGDCRFNLASDERMGFCFPVHGWQPPKIVADFVERLQINATRHYCFAVVTAGDNVGLTVQLFERMLAARGIHLDSAFTLIMPESYVGLRFMHLDTPQRAKEKVWKAAQTLEKIEDSVLDRRGGWYNIVEGRWPRTNTKILGAAFRKWLVSDAPFHVDTEKCSSCGICKAKCPVHNIHADAQGHPQWLHNGKCLTCFACYHYCPRRAIDYGKQTLGVGQYHFDERALGLSATQPGT